MQYHCVLVALLQFFKKTFLTWATIWWNSVEPSLTIEERKERLKEATLRAQFVQQLVLSSLVGDN